jgi:hypothetical protein
MEKIKNNIERYKIPQKQFKYEWTALAHELTKVFKQNCYWIPHKFEMWKIRQALKVTQKEQPDNFKYFLGVIRKI